MTFEFPQNIFVLSEFSFFRKLKEIVIGRFFFFLVVALILQLPANEEMARLYSPH